MHAQKSPASVPQRKHGGAQIKSFQQFNHLFPVLHTYDSPATSQQRKPARDRRGSSVHSVAYSLSTTQANLQRACWEENAGRENKTFPPFNLPCLPSAHTTLKRVCSKENPRVTDRGLPTIQPPDSPSATHDSPATLQRSKPRRAVKSPCHHSSPHLPSTTHTNLQRVCSHGNATGQVGRTSKSTPSIQSPASPPAQTYLQRSFRKEPS